MFNNFPYTNFHNLNLDWIIKTVKILFSKSVFSINGIEPDAEGNVEISGTELGAVGTVNNIAPDAQGNVTLTASDVGAIATGQGVTKVNGISPNAEGNVLAGTVRSVNGISPTSIPTPGSISLTASDVGALSSTIDPVETVNGISPDANGNVNVGTVKSVNGSTPDAQGNVNLPTVAGVTSVDGVGPDSEGNVQLGNVYVKTINGISPTNGNVAIATNLAEHYTTAVTSGAKMTTVGAQILGRGNVAIINGNATVGDTAIAWNDELMTIPEGYRPIANFWLPCWDYNGRLYNVLLQNNGTAIFKENPPAVGTLLRFSACYPIYGVTKLPIVANN